MKSTTFGRLPLLALGAGLLIAAVLLALSKPAQRLRSSAKYRVVPTWSSRQMDDCS
jgi:hypothetical protein